MQVAFSKIDVILSGTVAGRVVEPALRLPKGSVSSFRQEMI